MTTHRSWRAPAAILFLAAACAGPAIRLEPQAASEAQPLVFELRDWDWDRSSLELEFRVTNHGDRPVFVARGFLALAEGERRMAPKSSAAVYRVAPGRSRTLKIVYPAVSESATGLTLEFRQGAAAFDEKQGEPLDVPPLRLHIGAAAAAGPPR